MKQINVTLLMCLGVAAFAQQVQFDYDCSANFSAYKTYQWVDYQRVAVGDQLLDQDIKRAVDEQLAGKGLQRVESGGGPARRLPNTHLRGEAVRCSWIGLRWLGWLGRSRMGQLGRYPRDDFDCRKRHADRWAIRPG